MTYINPNDRPCLSLEGGGHSFVVAVLYGQVSVFQPHLSDPFNGWTDRHIEQGFSYRQGSVSFLLDSFAHCATITVSFCKEYTLREGVSSVCVPFWVTDSGVEIGSIVESSVFAIPAGSYVLIAEITGGPSEPLCSFTFVSSEEPVQACLVYAADSDVSPAIG